MSKNGIGLAVLLTEAILSALGVEFDTGTVARAVEGVVVAGGLILLVWNQVTRRDVFAFIFKK